jgi:hypothetical protein
VSVEADVPEVETLYALGHWLLERERPGDALHVFRTMLVAAPADERSWLGLTQAHEGIGETVIARELHRLAEHAVPRSFRCPLARARFLRREGDETGADHSYQMSEARFLAFTPTDATLDRDEVAAAIARERDEP